MEYKLLKEFKNYEELYKIWNDEFHQDFLITKEVFYRNVINCINVCDEASFVAVDDNQVVGFIVAKTWNEIYKVNGYEDTGWISILYVRKSYRNCSIGTTLLTMSEDALKSLGKSTINLGKDPNNFFPGIPSQYTSSIHWFEKRGYTLVRDTYDLMNEVDNHTQLIKLPEIQYEIQYLTNGYYHKTMEFMERNFPGRWSYELYDYRHRGGTGREYLILIDKGDVIGFCRVNDHNTAIINYNMTWVGSFKKPGGIGPLGIDSNYRGQNLGFYIVAYATNELIQKNVSNIVIDWTSLISFYQKFGFSVWKTYRYAFKSIKR